MAKRTKLSVGKKEDIKKKMLDFRQEAEEGNKSAFIRMTENERFKIGHQWDHDTASFNEGHGKFSLTINEILPIILDIAGTQQENPLDYKVFNVKGGTRIIAEILTALTKNIMDKSMGREEASRSFEAGVSIARGFLAVDIDYTNDPLNGDLVVMELDPFMVLPDPTCKTYDYNKEKGGAKYIIIDSWEDKGKIEGRYPGKKEELKSATFDVFPQGRFGAIISSIFGGGGPNLHLKDDYRHHDDNTFKEEMESNVSKQTNNYRVSTYWWKEWKKGVYVQKIDDPLNYLALTEPKAIAEAKRLAENDENVKVIEKDNFENQLTVPVLNKTVMVGDILLESIEDPFDGMNLYPIVRFAPFFDHGYEYPPVQNLVGPQKLINYTFSSLVNILKNVANSGWKVGKTSQRWLEWLEENSSQDGLVIDLSKFSGKAEKIETTEYPTGFDIITERGKQNMREISQVQVEVPRRPGSPESGRALAIREGQSIKTKGIIFRNWNHTNILMARVIVELVRNTGVFSDDEIMAIVDEDDLLDDKILDQAKGIIINQLQQQGTQIPQQPQPPNPIRMSTAPPEMQAQMLDKFKENMITYQQFVEQVEQAAIPIAKDIVLKLLKQTQQGRYGIKVDTSPMAPTLRIAQRLETLELHKSLVESGQPGISRTKLIEASDVPDKDAVIADVPQVQGAA